MDINKNQLTPDEIVLRDLEEIYIGNLNTVEADLSLPCKGRLGSVFGWQSKETLFLSNDGKVTRPTYGVGNRVVPLIVTANFQNSSKQREFQVTVLEQPRETKFTEIYPVDIQGEIGQVVDLPPVVIATEDTGVQVTLPVVWERFEIPLHPCTLQITGIIDKVDIKAKANIKFQSKNSVDKEALQSAKIASFPTESIKLKDGTLFYEAQERIIQYLLQTNDDQMLYNFRVAAGLDTKGAPPMTGWDAPECNLKGHTTGHYLSALALGWSATHNSELSRKINYMIQALEECQAALEKHSCHSGFLSAYSEEQFDLLEEFTTYPTIWAPYYTLDKIMSGLFDCYSIANNQQALKIVSKMGDWVYERLSKLSREKLDKMWSMYIAGEFGGMISVMVHLYHVTKKDKYLKAAYFFRNEKLYYPMGENVDTLKDMHANQHIPQIIGALELYKAGGSSRYLHIARNFWNMVTGSHAYNIGGVGETEMFHEPNKAADYISDKTAESCASYNMLRLTSGLFKLYPSGDLMDYYELVLYNHIMASGSHTDDGGTTYFMPLRPAGQKEYNTDENTCCHGTGLESRFRYIQDIYAYNENEVYVNLYIASILDTENMKLEQSWSINNPGYSSLVLKTPGKRTICLRIPVWAKEDFTVKVCGEKCEIGASDDGYIRISRDWGVGDIIEVYMSYHFRIIPEPSEKKLVSIAYGPFILAALSESEDYLLCPNDIESLNDSIKILDSPLHFNIDGVVYLPIAEVNKEKYHAYFRR
ncbi:beta-L-arabinofuranosidase domain-containing protein [Clostridium oryzae]|uniref:Non-reducing end beta-L-arabinofuranosidase n=1 Tax=Clostridium oryzae TaxID=1450648 RepID=A0A1V4II80_9CLOT|nr:beta-L-arabinofuranosidase domain-containing protein [Clostridium oryzae]OPJ59636.1 Non-reducing end beta-L-arabinofuranosidase [Clostridium oryzae]